MLQTQALQVLLSGNNVFLTGEAGSGKTHVLSQFIDEARNDDLVVAVTASTGIAATHLGGTTIHSWAGIGINDYLDEKSLKKIALNAITADRIKDTDVLIIDEISMIDANRLDMINQVTKYVRQSTAPFGGLQLVLCGDLFQLPPISKNREKDYVFEGNAWQEANFSVCYLSEQYRHEDDNLIDILTAIRSNTVNEDHIERLTAQIAESDEEFPDRTILFTHNADVDDINNKRLDSIDEEAKVYAMRSKGDRRASMNMIRGCMAPEELVLKKGAEVMFVSNNFAGKYVNGTRGRVIGFEDTQPIVQVGKKKIVVEEHTWKLEDAGDVVAQITQLPLRLAWAITVHKSQGMSLDNALIDLSRAFEPGMGYVALSRVRTLKGLGLKGINNVSLTIDQAVLDFDQILKQQSKATLTNI